MMITQVKLAGAKKEYLLEGHPCCQMWENNWTHRPLGRGPCRTLSASYLCVSAFSMAVFPTSGQLPPFFSGTCIPHCDPPTSGKPWLAFPILFWKRRREGFGVTAFRSQAHPWCILPRPGGHVVESYMSKEPSAYLRWGNWGARRLADWSQIIQLIAILFDHYLYALLININSNWTCNH